MIYGHAAEIAIRATLYLAGRPPGELSPVRNIAEAAKLPSPYLSKVNPATRTGGTRPLDEGASGSFRTALMNISAEVAPQSVRSAHLSLRAIIVERVRTLDPAYFALIMATGIVAIAARLTGIPIAGVALSWFNSIAFIVLVIMTIARAVLFPRLMLADLIDHQRGVSESLGSIGDG